MAVDIKKVSRWLLIVFYLSAGTNHLINADFYYPLIPDYMPFHVLINVMSGVLEIILGSGLMIRSTRLFSTYGIIAMLVLFIPSHVHFIIIGGCVPDGLCVPLWVAWFRLVVVHPLLILWAWKSK